MLQLFLDFRINILMFRHHLPLKDPILDLFLLDMLTLQTNSHSCEIHKNQDTI